MKKVISSIVCLIIIFTSQLVYASQSDIGYLVSNANIRKEPTTESVRLFTFNKGKVVNIIEQKNDWCKILLGDGDYAYIFAPLVLKEIDYSNLEKISEYKTSLDLTNENRISNIEYANKMNNVAIKPQEIFSFNSNCNTDEDDINYKVAEIYVNGKLSKGNGGGICQVSTNIYNAVKNLEVKITERHPHSGRVTYVPEGQDAAVSIGYKDFKFVNQSADTLYIRNYIDRENKRLVTEIYK